MARKQNYSFQRRERDASKAAKRLAKQTARHASKELDPAETEETAVPGATEAADVVPTSR